MDNFERKQALMGIVETIIGNSNSRELRQRHFRIIELFNYNKAINGYMILMDGLPLSREEAYELNEMVHGAESQIDYSETTRDFSNIKLVYYQAPPIDKKRTFRDGSNLGRPPKNKE